MDDHGTLSKHFWLAQGMARTLGVNVNDAMRQGRMGREAFAELVALCCHCGRAQACMDWMGRQHAGAEELPGWCPLKPHLEALREPA